jgi:hypothetical protein
MVGAGELNSKRLYKIENFTIKQYLWMGKRGIASEGGMTILVV